MTEAEMIKLLIRERAMILGYAQAIVGSVHLAEDIYQEMAVVALKKRIEVDELKNPGSWFRKIARLSAMNTIRKKKPMHLDSDVLDLLDEVWDRNDQSNADRIEGLRHCIDKLPPKMKQVIEMRYDDGMNSEVVAERLDVTSNTVYIYVSKAHRLLRECIERFISLQGQHNG